MRQKFTWKSVQNHYKRLLADFDKSDKRNQLMRSVGGEVGELLELLMCIREALDDLEAKHGASRADQREADEEKEHMRHDLDTSS